MWQKLGFEPGGMHVVYPGNDRAVRGRGRILFAVSNCVEQGMQASSNRLLAASATRFSGSHDCGVAEARKTNHARSVRVC